MTDTDNTSIKKRPAQPSRRKKQTFQDKLAKAIKPPSGNGFGKVINLKPGENTKFISVNIELFNLPDIDLNNPAEVSKRLGEFFEIFNRYDIKPSVSGLAMALGIGKRQKLYNVVNDIDNPKVARESRVLIKKAYGMLEIMWEGYMASGKVNPVTGIFLSKNHFGYRNQTEQVIRVENENDNYSSEEIKNRYISMEEKENQDE